MYMQNVAVFIKIFTYVTLFSIQLSTYVCCYRALVRTASIGTFSTWLVNYHPRFPTYKHNNTLTVSHSVAFKCGDPLPCTNAVVAWKTRLRYCVPSLMLSVFTSSSPGKARGRPLRNMHGASTCTGSSHYDDTVLGIPFKAHHFIKNIPFHSVAIQTHSTTLHNIAVVSI